MLVDIGYPFTVSENLENSFLTTVNTLAERNTQGYAESNFPDIFLW